MVSIGNLRLGGIPRVAGVIVDGWNKAIVDRAVAEGADLLELRIDCFKSLKEERVLEAVTKIKKRGLPLIATIRKKEEGGKKSIDDKRRLQLFKKVIPLVDAVDIELGSSRILKDVIDLAHRMDKKVIVSYHNFKTTPGEKVLEGVVKRGKVVKGDIVKIATMARNRTDILRLLRITARYKNLITICVGRMGAISRVLFPLMGSLITYGSLGSATAPGQLSLVTIKEQLRLYYTGYRPRS